MFIIGGESERGVFFTETCQKNDSTDCVLKCFKQPVIKFSRQVTSCDCVNNNNNKKKHRQK